MRRPKKITPETRKLLREGKGYRTEHAYGSGVRTPSDVVRYEYYDLGNDDAYVQNQMVEALGLPKYTTPDEVFMHIEQDYDDDYTALWLTSKNSAKDYYCSPEEDISKCPDDVIDEYEIPKDSVVLQDLGYDGALFLFKKGRTGRRRT